MPGRYDEWAGADVRAAARLSRLRHTPTRFRALAVPGSIAMILLFTGLFLAIVSQF